MKIICHCPFSCSNQAIIIQGNYKIHLGLLSKKVLPSSSAFFVSDQIISAPVPCKVSINPFSLLRLLLKFPSLAKIPRVFPSRFPPQSFKSSSANSSYPLHKHLAAPQETRIFHFYSDGDILNQHNFCLIANFFQHILRIFS